MPSRERKLIYGQKLLELLESHTKVLIVGADFVGSKQIQQIRIALRGKATVLMGKNTMIRKIIKNTGNADYAKINDLIKLNVGLIFTNGDLGEIRDVIKEYRVGAPAKAGVLSPKDVFIEAGLTDMEPTQTSFFQAINVPTKISRGKIEILTKTQVCIEGEKVGSSQAALLQKLGVKPFEYGLELQSIWDNGSTYTPEVLDISASDMIGKFMAGIGKVAEISLGLNYPTLASIPHSIANAYKNVLAIALCDDVEYSFERADKVKEILENPEAFMVAGGDDGGNGGGEEKKEEAQPEPEEEESEEEEDDMEFDLFD